MKGRRVKKGWVKRQNKRPTWPGLEEKDHRVVARGLIEKVRAMLITKPKSVQNERIVADTHLGELYELFIDWLLS